MAKREDEKERKCPTKVIEAENFLSNEQVRNLLEKKDHIDFKQEDYKTLYNCVHCRDCGTSDERVLLKQKFINDGNTIKDLEKIKRIFDEYGTPYKDNKSRIQLPGGIPQKSETLLYFGCFTSVKTPKYGEHAAKYLLEHDIDFTVLAEEICCGYPLFVTGETEVHPKLIEKNKQIFQEHNFQEIITVCPSCYMVFKEHYSDLSIKVSYYTDYLEPAREKKEGTVSIQHACPLVYDKIEGIDEYIENLLRSSGYQIMDIPMWCCGGGVGYQLRTDVAEKIARRRVHDYNGDYVTYYCPDCYWFIRVFGKKERLNLTTKDLFELL
ncbi:MAG: (Fe-S)-binding protein [Promethearchaeia archaeon]